MSVGVIIYFSFAIINCCQFIHHCIHSWNTDSNWFFLLILFNFATLLSSSSMATPFAPIALNGFSQVSWSLSCPILFPWLIFLFSTSPLHAFRSSIHNSRCCQIPFNYSRIYITSSSNCSSCCSRSFGRPCTTFGWSFTSPRCSFDQKVTLPPLLPFTTSLHPSSPKFTQLTVMWSLRSCLLQPLVSTEYNFFDKKRKCLVSSTWSMNEGNNQRSTEIQL